MLTNVRIAIEHVRTSARQKVPEIYRILIENPDRNHRCFGRNLLHQSCHCSTVAVVIDMGRRVNRIAALDVLEIIDSFRHADPPRCESLQP